MEGRIIAAGHLCVDLAPAFLGEGPQILGDIFSPGRLTVTGEMGILPGGSAANTGLAVKALGGRVDIIALVGNDGIGSMTRSLFEKLGAAGRLIGADGAPSSYTVVLSPPGCDRMFLHCPGANNLFSAEHICDEALCGAAILHLGYPPLLKRFLDPDELAGLFARAKRAGAATSLDLAMVDPKSGAGAVDWADYLARTLPLCDLFEPSVEELCYMLDRPLLERVRSRRGDFSEAITPAETASLADRAMALGPAALLLKCGGAGLVLRLSGRERLERVGGGLAEGLSASANLALRLPALKINHPGSAAGAGDSAIAAFLLSLVGSRSPEKAARLAAAAGASVAGSGIRPFSLPPLTELERLLELGWNERVCPIVI